MYQPRRSSWSGFVCKQSFHIVSCMPRHPVGLDHRVSPLGSFIRQQPFAPRLRESDKTNHVKPQCRLGAFDVRSKNLGPWPHAAEASMPRHTTFVAPRSRIAPSPRAVPPMMTWTRVTIRPGRATTGTTRDTPMAVVMTTTTTTRWANVLNMVMCSCCY